MLVARWRSDQHCRLGVIQAGAFLCSICMFSPTSRGFPLVLRLLPLSTDMRLGLGYTLRD